MSVLVNQQKLTFICWVDTEYRLEDLIRARESREPMLLVDLPYDDMYIDLLSLILNNDPERCESS